MHHTAMQFAERALRLAWKPEWAEHDTMCHIVEFGAQNVNGTVRDLFEPCGYSPVWYCGIDLEPADDVTLVMDAADVTVDHLGWRADIVICTNVFEHVQHWNRLIEAAARILRPGGWFILQAAGRGFQVHSGRRESLELDPGEWYENIEAKPLDHWLRHWGFTDITINEPSGWPQDICSTSRLGEP